MLEDSFNYKSDYLFFRVYKDGKPYTPHYHFKLSKKELKENDYVINIGFPGESDDLYECVTKLYSVLTGPFMNVYISSYEIYKDECNNFFLNDINKKRCGNAEKEFEESTKFTDIIKDQINSKAHRLRARFDNKLMQSKYGENLKKINDIYTEFKNPQHKSIFTLIVPQSDGSMIFQSITNAIEEIVEKHYKVYDEDKNSDPKKRLYITRPSIKYFLQNIFKDFYHKQVPMTLTMAFQK